jgi:hypothetical protein
MVYLVPSEVSSTVRVRLFGTGMGSDLDLAVLSFQVPRSGLLCASSEMLAKAAKTASLTNLKMVFIGFPP